MRFHVVKLQQVRFTILDFLQCSFTLLFFLRRVVACVLLQIEQFAALKAIVCTRQTAYVANEYATRVLETVLACRSERAATLSTTLEFCCR